MLNDVEQKVRSLERLRLLGRFFRNAGTSEINPQLDIINLQKFNKKAIAMGLGLNIDVPRPTDSLVTIFNRINARKIGNFNYVFFLNMIF